nr:sugar transferase [Nevskia sp.]
MKSATRSVSPDLLRQMSGHADDAPPHTALPLLPVLDFVTLLVVGYVSLFLFEALFAPSGWQAAGGMDAQRMTLTTAALGAFALHDRQFGARRHEADSAAWVGRFVARFLVLVGVLGVIAFAGRWLGDLPSALLLPWLLAALAITFASRALLRWQGREAGGRNASTLAARPSAEVDGLIGDRLAVRVLADRPITRWSAALKTGVDRLACVILLLLLAPVMLLIVLAIKIDSPGPVLFRQRRHGFRSR